LLNLNVGFHAFGSAFDCGEPYDEVKANLNIAIAYRTTIWLPMTRLLMN
jgi:hypothetical protein